MSGFLDRFRFRKVHELLRPGQQILFYHTNPDGSFVLSGLETLAKEFADVALTHKFSRIEVFIDINKEFDNSIEAGLAVASEMSGMASVDIDEVKRWYNRIYVHEGTIINQTAKSLGANWRMDMGKARSEMRRILLGVLVHEMTHLWHLRANQQRDQTLRRVGRIRKVIREAQAKDYKEALDLWEFLRRAVAFLMEAIVSEGIAMFVEDLHTGSTVFTRDSLLINHRRAVAAARDLDERLHELYKLFNATYFSTTFIDPHVKKQANGQIFAAYENISEFAYKIGLHVYHTILFAHPELTLQDLAKTDYAKLIKLYEESCANAEVDPVVTMFSQKGVFCYREHIKTLTDLRKGKY